MVAMVPEINDADIQDNLYTTINPSIDWLQERLTPEEKVNEAKSHLELLKVDLSLLKREIPEITYDMLATDQKQAYEFTKILFLSDESGIIMILGPTGSKKVQQSTQ